MTFIADWWKAGVLPLQCHDLEYEEDYRPMVVASRISGTQKGKMLLDGTAVAGDAVKKVGPLATGDLLCSSLWLQIEGKRTMPGWAFAWPSLTEAPADKDDEAMHVLPIAYDSVDDEATHAYVKDNRFGTKRLKNDILFPHGWPGLTVAGSEHRAQFDMFFPAMYGLVSAWYGPGRFSTIVHDIDDKGALDPIRRAPLHTLTRCNT